MTINGQHYSHLTTAAAEAQLAEAFGLFALILIALTVVIAVVAHNA